MGGIDYPPGGKELQVNNQQQRRKANK